jgi:hypothetical protein
MRMPGSSIDRRAFAAQLTAVTAACETVCSGSLERVIPIT